MGSGGPRAGPNIRWISPEPGTIPPAEFKVVRLDVIGTTALVVLDRPERMNAWTGRMHHEYRSALAVANASNEVRVIVVTGEGRAFCAGADSAALESHSDRGGYDPGTPDCMPSPGSSVHEAFDADFAYHFGLDKPVIAAINGPAAGVGLVLACYCDLRFAAPGVKLTTSHGRLNLPAEYGLSWLLPRIVGVGRALDLLLTSRVILTEEALEWGLVNQVHPPDELLTATLDFAEELARNVSRESLRQSRQQVWVDQHRPIRESVEFAGEKLGEMMTQPDYAKGVRALIDKRSPDFD
jgi:enoyl-CoA hydratase/carnithine racemase